MLWGGEAEEWSPQMKGEVRNEAFLEGHQGDSANSDLVPSGGGPSQAHTL